LTARREVNRPTQKKTQPSRMHDRNPPHGRGSAFDRKMVFTPIREKESRCHDKCLGEKSVDGDQKNAREYDSVSQEKNLFQKGQKPPGQENKLGGRSVPVRIRNTI